MRRYFRPSNLCALIFALSFVCGPTTAVAGPDQARKYFKQAKQAYTEGDYERAAALLEKAYAEEPNLTYQYNRIRALEGAGDYEGALEVLNNYEQPMLDAQGFEDIKDIKKSLQKKVEKEPEPTEEETANLREASDKSGGSSGDGAADGSGETAEDGSADETSGGSGGTMRILGWSLTGVGIASGLTAGLFGSTLLLPKPAREALTNPDKPLQGTAKKQVEAHRTMTIVFGSVGAAALIGGGVILLTQPSGSGGSSSTAALDPRVTPFVSRDGGGATLQLRF
ncbi:MAG: hypothetical protein ABEN55_12405 [Bradymonadaceae bacterium]